MIHANVRSTMTAQGANLCRQLTYTTQNISVPIRCPQLRRTADNNSTVQRNCHKVKCLK